MANPRVINLVLACECLHSSLSQLLAHLVYFARGFFDFRNYCFLFLKLGSLLFLLPLHVLLSALLCVLHALRSFGVGGFVLKFDFGQV